MEAQAQRSAPKRRLRRRAAWKDPAFRTFLDATTAAFALHEMILDDDGKPVDYRFLMLSPGFERLTGLKSCDLVGKTIVTAFPETEPYIDAYAKVVRTGVPVRLNHYIPAMDGHYEVSVYRPAPGQFAYAVADVTTYAKAEAALRQNYTTLEASEEKYRLLVQHSEDVIFSMNPDGTYRFVNQAFAHRFGKSPEELAGQTPHDLFAPEEAERRLAVFRRVFETARTVEMQTQVVVGPELRLHLTTVSPVTDAQGRTLWVSCISKDITEHRREEELRESEERYRATIEQSLDGIVVVDEAFQIVEWNAAQAHLSGYSRAEMLGRYLWDYQYSVTPDAQKMPGLAECLRKDLIDSRISSEAHSGRFLHDVELQRKNGELRTVQVVEYSASVSGNSVYGRMYRDVTARRQAETALRESEERFRLATEATHAMTYEVDLHAMRISATHGMTQLLGQAPENAGLTLAWWESQVHPDDAECVRKAFRSRAVLGSGGKLGLVYRIRHADGSYRFVEDHGKPICDDAGRVTRLVGTIINITERETARRELERLTASGAEFLAACSHELKTPLTVLLANIGVFQRMFDALEAPRRDRFLGAMAEQVKRLDRLVLDLLDLSRVESGHLSVALVPTPVRPLVSLAVDRFAKMCSTHAVRLESMADCTANIDHIRVEQILLNLLANATKYSPGGTTVTVSLSVSDQSALLSVADQGNGSAEADVVRLSKSGSGMGLHLASELARLHGGSISVCSTVGVGSTFTLSLPLSSCAGEAG